MRLHQLAGKRQAETQRLPLFRLLGSLEPIECKRLRLDVHARPVVRYNDTCRSGRAISVDKHTAAHGRIAHGTDERPVGASGVRTCETGWCRRTSTQKKTYL